VRLISADLSSHGIGNVVMTGETSDRQALVHRFQTESEIKAFVMTLKTGGAGLNLTAADYIFIMDPWWNASAESQAVDRAHRIGQKTPVFCYKLIARDTIEERILQLQQRKQALVASILTDDAGSMRKFSPEDIEYLLGGSDE
jgi:SNF2 family DNA or RNA helicase